MKVKCLDHNNEALLQVIEKSSEELIIEHSNYDDGHWGCTFQVIGTTEEIRIIKEFCNKIDIKGEKK